MQLQNGWQEILPDIDYRKGLKHCTLRVARVSKEHTEWIIEISVGLLMVGTMRQIIEASTPELAMNKTEIIAKERFYTLRHFYSALIKEVECSTSLPN